MLVGSNQSNYFENATENACRNTALAFICFLARSVSDECGEWASQGEKD